MKVREFNNYLKKVFDFISEAEKAIASKNKEEIARVKQRVYCFSAPRGIDRDTDSIIDAKVREIVHRLNETMKES